MTRAAIALARPEAGPLVIGDAPLTVRGVAAAARGSSGAVLGAAAQRRVAAGHASLERLAASGAAIYGVSTGLGAAVDTRIAAGDAETQRRIILARMVGIGPPAEPDTVRAVMIARLAGLATGRSGASPAIVQAYADMLDAGLVPDMPLIGSVGEADLAPLAHVAGVLVGAGTARLAGVAMPGAAALAQAGIRPPTLGPKDGLALVSSNAVSAGLAALALADAERLFGAWLAAASLSLEAYRGNVAPLRAEAAALRPAPGQADAGGALLALLAGGDLVRPGAARRLQDPLSFRCLAPVLGAALHALRAAIAAVELELNSADDNPAVIAEAGTILPNANFDPTHLVLACETLGLAVSRVAAAQAQRILKLMSAESSGLPRFLSPIQNGRSGLATVQKTVGVLLAEIGRHAVPMPAFVLPAADGVEDYGTLAVSVVQKTATLLGHARTLAAIELLVAAQANDLREGIALGHGAAGVQAAIRARVAMLEDDRPSAPDIRALDELIASGIFDAHAAALFSTSAVT